MCSCSLEFLFSLFFCKTNCKWVGDSCETCHAQMLLLGDILTRQWAASWFCPFLSCPFFCSPCYFLKVWSPAEPSVLSPALAQLPPAKSALDVCQGPPARHSGWQGTVHFHPQSRVKIPKSSRLVLGHKGRCSLLGKFGLLSHPGWTEWW